MRWLVWYIRSMFCKHIFSYSEMEHNSIYYTFSGSRRKLCGPKVSATCTKCGYHKSYWKFGS